MKRNLIIGSLVALLAAAAMPASALASQTITVEPAPEVNLFDPPTATLDLGDGYFEWVWGPNGAGAASDHNVIQDEAFFTSGSAFTSRPPLRVTASAGTYGYFCNIHLGMNGVVSVRPALAPGASTSGSGSAIDFGWADAQTTTGNRYDVRYRTGKKWKTWLKKTKKQSGKFGKKKKPVKVKSGRTYEFQARSRQGSAKSEWSPSLVVDA